MVSGQYDFIHGRVEISKFLKLYPELHNFVLEHEKKHAKIQEEHGLSWRHFTLDMKDRWRLFNDKTLWKQMRDFSNQRRARNLKEVGFVLLYQLFSTITAFFSVATLRHIVRKRHVFWLMLLLGGFLFRAYPHMFLIPRWIIEEEYNVRSVTDLLEIGSTRQFGFYPILEHYIVFLIYLVTNINPIVIMQYINPLIGSLTVIPIYLLFKQSLTKKQAYIGSVFWVFSEAIFYRTATFNSTEGLGILFAITSLFLFKTKRYKLLPIFVVATFYSHLLPAVFVVVTIILHKLLYGKRNERILVVVGTIFLVVFLYSPLNPHQRIISIINPEVYISYLNLGNISLYSTSDIFLGVQIFLGSVVLVSLSVFPFFKSKVNDKLIRVTFFVSLILFVWSWFVYNPHLLSPTRVVIYFIIALTYYSSQSVSRISKCKICKVVSPLKITEFLPVLLVSLIMVSSTISGLQTMLFIDDCMTIEEYNFLDKVNEDMEFTNIASWWTDYVARIAITARVPKGLADTVPLNISRVEVLYSEYYLNPTSTIKNDTIFQYVFLSPRIQEEGLFLLYTKTRTIQIRKPVIDVWAQSDMWEILYEEKGMKIYVNKEYGEV